MKVLVFSDSHLYNKYDKEFVKWVEHWSKKVDKIIICGDFWDRFFFTFDEFVNSKYKDTLFPILKSRNTHYIYGNHDPKDLSDERVSLFSDSQSEALELDINGKILRFEHGQRFGTPINAGDFSFVGRIEHLIQEIVIRIFGYRIMSVFSSQINNIQEIWLDDKRFLVCGHTHLGARGDNFFVLKPSAFGLRYGLIIEDGKLSEVKKYEQT